jgi:Ca2+-transporting ATPase
MAFATLAFSQLFHAFNIKDNERGFFASHPLGNRYLLGAFAVSAMLMLLVLLVPPLMGVFKVVSLDITHWLYIAALSIAPIIEVDIMKWLKLN